MHFHSWTINILVLFMHFQYGWSRASVCLIITYIHVFPFRKCWKPEMLFQLLCWKVIYCNCWRRITSLSFVEKQGLERLLRSNLYLVCLYEIFFIYFGSPCPVIKFLLSHSVSLYFIMSIFLFHFLVTCLLLPSKDNSTACFLTGLLM